ncbi:thiamine pyrophosphokinase 1 [Anaeramoeba ignava]|uniref:Thiamine pyrophosphokinase 1 n=1 Tax=Anaeramoeba ignava TaxID=1746090 RepID=A0A9Q0RBQ9_ANAIG|nr:thiamine pyrophosphokinase 1 [Anaeramoeba ignava]
MICAKNVIKDFKWKNLFIYEFSNYIRLEKSPFQQLIKNVNSSKFSRSKKFSLPEIKKQMDKKEKNPNSRLKRLPNQMISFMVILNHDVPPYLHTFFPHTSLTICADGGANRLYKNFSSWNRQKFLPDFIIGDLDSIEPKVRKYYEKNSVQVIHKKDQNSNDLYKCLDFLDDYLKQNFPCLNLLQKHQKAVRNIDIQKPLLKSNEKENENEKEKEKENEKEKEKEKENRIKNEQLCLSSNETIDEELARINLFVMGAIGGRLDHEFANFHAAFSFQNYRIFLFSNENYTRFLNPGTHKIFVHPKFEGPICGIIPLSAPCNSITTTGLKWNLNKDKLEFGNLISTSNEIVSDVVTIETSDPVLWIVQIHPFWK